MGKREASSQTREFAELLAFLGFIELLAFVEFVGFTERDGDSFRLIETRGDTLGFVEIPMS